MKATQALHQLGQSLWLDNITRTLLFSREQVLAARLQSEGVDAFANSWHALLARIHEKCASSAERA